MENVCELVASLKKRLLCHTSNPQRGWWSKRPQPESLEDWEFTRAAPVLTPHGSIYPNLCKVRERSERFEVHEKTLVGENLHHWTLSSITMRPYKPHTTMDYLVTTEETAPHLRSSEIKNIVLPSLHYNEVWKHGESHSEKELVLSPYVQ